MNQQLLSCRSNYLPWFMVWLSREVSHSESGRAGTAQPTPPACATCAGLSRRLWGACASRVCSEIVIRGVSFREGHPGPSRTSCDGGVGCRGVRQVAVTRVMLLVNILHTKLRHYHIPSLGQISKEDSLPRTWSMPCSTSAILRKVAGGLEPDLNPEEFWLTH